jgi:hypothetical protein
MIDWTSLTILEDDDDGLQHQIVDEDQVYEAMGFKEANGRMEAEDRTDEVVIPAMSTQMHAEMEEAAVEVDDTVPEEPMFEWDRDNPDMSVGICYPSMPEFRLAMRQYAIVHEFEYETEKSDRDRFRGNCATVGCNWRIRAKTQHDGSVRVYKFVVCLSVYISVADVYLFFLFCRSRFMIVTIWAHLHRGL